MEKNLEMMTNSKLEAILYTPTEDERHEISMILVDRYKKIIQDLTKRIEDLEGKK